MVRYATMKDRTFAFLIDIIFVSGLGFLIGMIVSLIDFIFPFLHLIQFKTWFCVICSIILIWLYFAILDSSKKQGTIGKMVMKIKVTDMKYKRISFKRASKRFFLKIISFAINPNNKGQISHDKLSDCLVIKE